MKSLAGSPYHVETEYYRQRQESPEMPYISSKDPALTIAIKNLLSRDKPCPAITIIVNKTYYLQTGPARVKILGSSFVEMKNDHLLTAKKRGKIQTKITVSLGQDKFDKILVINAVDRIVHKGVSGQIYLWQEEE